MALLTRDEIKRFPGSDVDLSGIEWLEDGSLRLKLVMPGSKKREALLLGIFAAGVHMDLRFRQNTGGRPMTGDMSLDEIPGRGWHVLIDFAGAPDGTIEFDCTELQIDTCEHTGPTRSVQATGHRRCDLELMMKFEPLTEHRPVGLQASA